MVHNSLHNRDRVKQQPPLVTAIVVRRKFEPLVSIQRVVGLLLCELDKEVGTGAGFLPRSGDAKELDPAHVPTGLVALGWCARGR